jgi:protein SCO1/2
MGAECQSAVRLIVLLAVCLASWGIIDYGRTLADDKRADYFPKVTLKTQDGKDDLFYDDLIKNNIVIISIFYTKCAVCERATKNLLQVQKALGDRLGREVFMYSITLDPEDDPKALKAYAEKHGLKPGWTLLTGNAKDITALRDRLGLFNLTPEMREKLGMPKLDPKKAADQKLHSGMIVIRNDAFNRQTMTSALSTPDQILQIIERLKPPPKK